MLSNSNLSHMPGDLKTVQVTYKRLAISTVTLVMIGLNYLDNSAIPFP